MKMISMLQTHVLMFGERHMKRQSRKNRTIHKKDVLDYVNNIAMKHWSHYPLIRTQRISYSNKSEFGIE